MSILYFVLNKNDTKMNRDILFMVLVVEFLSILITKFYKLDKHCL